MMPSLMPTMPYSSASATRQMRPTSCLRLADHKGSDRERRRAAVPAAEIEQLVSDRVHRWLLDPGSIDKSTAARLADPSIQHRRVARAAEIGKHWPELPVAGSARSSPR